MADDKAQLDRPVVGSGSHEASVDADLEPSTAKDEAQDERLDILVQNPCRSRLTNTSPEPAHDDK
jgi:hypothetical protein